MVNGQGGLEVKCHRNVKIQGDLQEGKLKFDIEGKGQHASLNFDVLKVS